MDGLQISFNPIQQPQHFGGGRMHEEVYVINGGNDTFGN